MAYYYKTLRKKLKVMLKAVRFDLEDHKHLLDYIDNYRDKKGKPNHSEAIRSLMEKGFENLNSSPTVEHQTKIQPIDINQIKDQVYNQVYTEIMEELTKKVFSQMSQPIQSIQSLPTQQQVKLEEPKKEVTIDPPKPKPPTQNVNVNTVAGGNALLANILGNASR